MSPSEEQIKKKIQDALKGEGDLGEIDLSSFGLDAESLKTFAPLIKKIIDEIKRESFRFVEEEKRILETKNDAVRTIGDLLTKNIMSIRSFLLTLMTVSLAVMGAIISVWASNIFIMCMLYIGLGSLAICVLTSIIYLTFIHVRENNELTESLNFQKKAFRKLHRTLIEYHQENKTFDEYLKEKLVLFDKNREIEEAFTKKIEERSEKKDYFPHIVSGSFLLGILLIALSFILNGK